MGPAIPIITLATTVAGAGMSAFSSLQQGAAKSADLKNQAAGYNNQADIAAENARRTRIQTDNDVASFREKVIQLTGSQNVAAATSGVTASGSVLDVMASDSKNAEVDALTITYKGRIDEQNQLYQEAANRMLARSSLRSAKTASTQGVIGAASSVLSAGVSLVSKGSELSKAFSSFNGGCKVAIK